MKLFKKIFKKELVTIEGFSSLRKYEKAIDAAKLAAATTASQEGE
ncbi:hypothetical protein [Spiroplasma clarkii]|nr:hypothetical protein [Spiroplasma clarkii]